MDVSSLRGRRSRYPLRVALVGNHPPRRCGIATYTRDVAIALRAAGHIVHVTAMSEPGRRHSYGSAVDLEVRQEVRADYAMAGRAIAAWAPDVVFVQHEFGIFGGPAGAWLIDLIDAANVPNVVQLHTVLAEPDFHQRAAMEALRRRTASFVVMAARGRDMLAETGLCGLSVHVVPHGTPNRARIRPADMRRRLDWSDRPTLLTFGLISPGKGIETAIAALPAILSRVPDARYVLLGATHPMLLAQEGERYREGLIDLARRLGVEKALRMQNRYLNDAALCDALQAADVYVTPYLNRAQITSGTLACALACGVPTVSTPYWHAEDVLPAELLFSFGDVDGLAARATDLLTQPDRREALARRAWNESRSAIWPAIAHRLDTVLWAAAQVDMPTIAAE